MIQLGTREQLNKREAEQIEEEYRQELKANMNMRRCFTTEEQKQEQKKDCDKKYYKSNIDKIVEYHQNYYKENADKINEKVKCECGCMIRRGNLSTHKKRPKHIKLMNQIKTENEN
jgi:hypothetical protein